MSREFPSGRREAGAAETRLVLIGLLFAGGLSGCSQQAAPVREADYAATIVGAWRGSVGDDRETIAFRGDGTFVSEVRRRGFISNTLGEGVTGTVHGTWAIAGKAMTLKISGAENMRVINGTTSSTIASFVPNELVVRSDTAGTSRFVRL